MCWIKIWITLIMIQSFGIILLTTVIQSAIGMELNFVTSISPVNFIETKRPYNKQSTSLSASLSTKTSMIFPTLLNQDNIQSNINTNNTRNQQINNLSPSSSKWRRWSQPDSINSYNDLLLIKKKKQQRDKRGVPPEYADSSSTPRCEKFVVGEPDIKTLFSPGHPNNYPNNTDCVVVLEAPPGFLLRLDFRDYFNIEPSEECKFDYLEIRDGAHGFSTLLGQFCGTKFPPMLTSRERHLWLHFHSDENIEYRGFVAIYEFIPRPTTFYEEESCRIEVSGYEGFVNKTDIPQERIKTAIEHSLPLDCMWIVSAREGWKLQLAFALFKLEKPNDCDSNFVDVFSERTDIPSRLKNFCGSIADAVTSKSNTLHVRFYAEPQAINSTFSILFTAFRDKPTGQACKDDEYDCEDATCISGDLRCNGRINCRFRWDEDECVKDSVGQSEHVIIIIVVFGLILGGMFAAFIFNCLRKLIRDQKIIREHIRQSKESKLDEVGRQLAKRSRENLSVKLSPRGKDSPNSINIIDDISNRYYREVAMPTSASRVEIKNENNSRNQEVSYHIKDILDSGYGDKSDEQIINSSYDGNMCDMACQTRESLFQPVFKNKIIQQIQTQPTQHQPQCPVQGGIRFSTFGYDNPQQHQQQQQQQQQYLVNKSPKQKDNKKSRTVATTIEMEDFTANNIEPPPICKNFDLNNEQIKKHQHHHLHHHQHQQLYHQHPQTHANDDDQRTFSDIRKSAPDVIIMTSH